MILEKFSPEIRENFYYLLLKFEKNLMLSAPKIGINPSRIFSSNRRKFSSKAEGSVPPLTTPLSAATDVIHIQLSFFLSDIFHSIISWFFLTCLSSVSVFSQTYVDMFHTLCIYMSDVFF